MKCHAGVQFPDGKPCPQCGAKLGEVCWPGINNDLQELQQFRQRAKLDALAPCEYCGSGKRTGLPGNACENCMNTGYAHPDKAELALAAVELEKLPSNVFWVLAKGRLTPTEPLWAVRITDFAGETITETEGDHPADTVRAAAARLAILHEENK